MKKLLIFTMSFLILGLVSCSTVTTTANVETTTTATQDLEDESPCKDTPLDAACYVPSYDLDFISSTPDEYLITEDFEAEVINQQPMNWLLFTNSEYKTNGVTAKVIEENSNKFVRMYSDGLQKPLYPQSAPTPTFIFTTKFNLDQTGAGVAHVDLMIPETDGNSVTAGISTGAVNTISIVIDTDMSLLVKVGGPFFYYSQNGDGGDYYDTEMVLSKDTWYSFRFEWDAESNYLAAYLVETSGDTLLFEGEFHISNRFNVEEDGEIMVPNIVKVTMPFGRSGIAYLDNVIVERRGE
jgi:hypothetical protein